MLCVVKIGGAEGVGSERVLGEVARGRQAGKSFVLVHGGSHEVETLAKEMGVASATLCSPAGIETRYTNLATLRVLCAAIRGIVAPRLACACMSRGIPTVALGGFDGGIATAVRKASTRHVQAGRVFSVRDNYGGRLTAINTTLLTLLLSNGFTPLVSPPVFDGSGSVLNVDADSLAAAIAAELSADELIFISNVNGLRANSSEPQSVIDRVYLSDAASALEAATGRMKLKVMAAQNAVARGVGHVAIADSSSESPIADTRRGFGTVFLASRPVEQGSIG